MPFVSQEEFEERLQHPNNIVHKIKHDGKGRPKGVENIPQETRAVIGTLAKSVGPTTAAEIFDCSISQASNFSKGKTVSGEGNAELKAKVESETEHIHEVARDLVLKTLKIIDPELIREEKPRVQASIAKDLAGVIEKTTPKNAETGGVHINIYAPRQDKLDKYETAVLDIQGEVVK